MYRCCYIYPAFKCATLVVIDKLKVDTNHLWISLLLFLLKMISLIHNYKAVNTKGNMSSTNLPKHFNFSLKNE